MCQTYLQVILFLNQMVFQMSNLFHLLLYRYCPKEPICQALAPLTGEDTEGVTPEGEEAATVLRDIKMAFEADFGTSQQGHSTKPPILITRELLGGKDSGATLSTTTKHQSATHVSSSSRRPQKKWGRDLTDSTTHSSARTTRSFPPRWMGVIFRQQRLLSFEIRLEIQVLSFNVMLIWTHGTSLELFDLAASVFWGFCFFTNWWVCLVCAWNVKIHCNVQLLYYVNK